MKPKLIKINCNDDFTINLYYENNEDRVFDLKPFLNIGKYAELKDINLFKTAHISFNSIEWFNNLGNPTHLLSKTIFFARFFSFFSRSKDLCKKRKKRTKKILVFSGVQS